MHSPNKMLKNLEDSNFSISLFKSGILSVLFCLWKRDYLVILDLRTICLASTIGDLDNLLDINHC